MDGYYSFLNACAELNIQLPQLLVSLSTQYEGAYMWSLSREHGTFQKPASSQFMSVQEWLLFFCHWC